MSTLAPVPARIVQPERLRLARVLHGLTQKELAAKLEVSAPTLSQYESGASTPTPATMARLSVVLGMSQDYFTRPWRAPDLADPFFRSLRSTPQRDRDRARAHAQLVAEITAEIERDVELPDPDFDAGVLLDDDDPVTAAEGAATKLRHRWGLPHGPVGHVVRTLEHHGAVVAATSDFDSQLDAFTLRTRTRPIVVLCSEKGVATRRRFDAAHELAHVVLHERPTDRNKHQEAQAHRFASAFLMPPDTVGPWLITSPTQLDVLEDGAKTWGVSMQALVRRAKDLGTITDAAYTRTMRRMSALGWRTREPVDIGPPERPQLLQNAAAVIGPVGLTTIAKTTGIPLPRLHRILALPEDQLDDAPGDVVRLPARWAH